MIIPEKLTSVERALVAASKMDAPDARRVLMLICEAGMTTGKPIPQEPTEGEKHFAKREKFIQRMDATCKRVIKYAKHETLRKIEKHFRDNPTSISAAESGGAPTEPRASLAARLAFDRELFASELLAALREDQEKALGTAGQQLFDEIGRDAVWRLPSQDALQFIDVRANLLANVPDEIHREIMDSIEDGLSHGESRRQLMARISTAFDEISKSRSETIANTETAAAFNYSRDKAMREAGVTHKRWLHSMSQLIKEPRPTHLEADGQTVAIDEPFDVSGVKFMYPQDDSLGAGPEDVINCFCVSIAVEAPLESGEGEGHPFRGNQWTGGIVDYDNLKQEDIKDGRIGRFKVIGSRGRGDFRPDSDFDLVTELSPEEYKAWVNTPEGEYPIIPQEIKQAVRGGHDVFIKTPEGHAWKVETHPVSDNPDDVYLERISQIEKNLLSGGKR